MPKEKIPIKFPGGYRGIVLQAHNEQVQDTVFLPTDGILVAVNHEGEPEYGTVVCDLTDENEIDTTRVARLQTAWRVIKKPLFQPNTLALQLCQEGQGKAFGGYVLDTGADTEDLVLARLSSVFGGFLDVGGPKDKHFQGKDGDGRSINPAHITTRALFRRSNLEDGPLRFESDYKEGQDGHFVHPVHLAFTGVDWAWYVKVNIGDTPTLELLKPRPLKKPVLGFPQGDFLRPGVPTPGSPGKPGIPPVLPPVETPGTVKPSTPTTTPLPALEMCNEVATPGVLARPQTSNQKKLDLAHVPSGAFSDAARSQLNETPISGQIMGFGAQGGSKGLSYPNGQVVGASGDPWVYTQRPTKSKFYAGTTSGGFVVLPPEVTAGDNETGYAPPKINRSTTYFLVGPGAWFGAGIPDLTDGSVQDGWSWGMDTANGDLLFRTHVLGETPESGIKFAVATQDIAWRSGTSFWATLAHAHTADRTHTFMDVTANVAALLTGAGAPGATAPEGTLYWDTTNNLLYVNNDGASAWTLIAGGAGGVSGTGAATQVAYWTGATTIAGDAGMTYDAANDKLTITAAGGGPQQRLAYDGSNYLDLQVGATNDVTLFGPAAFSRLNITSSAASGMLILMTCTDLASAGEFQMTVNGSGDAFFHMAADSADWAWGLDNSDSNAWVLANGASLGTNNRIRVATTGATTILQWLNVGTATDAVAQGDVAFGLTGAGRLFFDQSIPAAYLYNSAGTIVNQLSGVAATATVWNEQGADIDFRVESDNEANMIFLDASADKVYIGGTDAWRFSDAAGLEAQGNLRFSHGTSALATSATEGFLHLQSCAGQPIGTPASIPTGQIPLVWDSSNLSLWAYSGGSWVRQPTSAGTGSTGRVTFWASADLISGDAGFTYDSSTDFATLVGGLSITGTAGQHTVINESGADADFRVEGDTATHLLFVDAGTDRVGIGTSGPDARLDVLHASAAQLRLSQADGSVYAQFQVDSDSLLTITTSTGAGLEGVNIPGAFAIGDPPDGGFAAAAVWGSFTGPDGGGAFYGLYLEPVFTEGGVGGTNPIIACLGVAGNAIVAGASTTDLAATVYLTGAPTGGSANYLLYGTISNALTDPIFHLNQASTGDAALRLSIGTTTSWAFGIDNSDSDQFKISWASSGTAVLGTNDVLRITTAGRLGLGASPDDRVHIASNNSNTDTAFGSQLGIILQNLNSTVGNYTSILNYDDTGTVNCGIYFKNVDHTNEGRLDFITRNSGGFAQRLSIIGSGNVGIGLGSGSPSARLHVTQPTIASEVFRIESVATNDDPSDRYFHGRVATTDATVTTINTVAIAASTAVMLEAHVRARRTGGTSGTAEDGAGYVIRATYKNVAGTATLIGAVNADYTAEDQAGWDATFAVSAGNVLLRVTGAANNNITWHSTVIVRQVGS